MPWYYAGPEAKPVGPVSLEELQAKQASGVISLDTYIVEHNGQADASRAWKRYREVFPATPPPLGWSSPLPPPIPPATPVSSAAPHPLFPSAGAAPTAQPVFRSPAGTYPYATPPPTNAWCLWGFVLSLLSVPFFCLGPFILLPALIASVVGLVQVMSHPGQAGRTRAIVGLLLSGFLMLVLLILFLVAIPSMNSHWGWSWSTTESTDDSQ